MSHSCSLIINADDLGYCSARDNAIFQLFQRGVVTSASLLVNSGSSEAALPSALALGLPVGLHFNLTEGVPLSEVVYFHDAALLMSSGRAPHCAAWEVLCVASWASVTL